MEFGVHPGETASVRDKLVMFRQVTGRKERRSDFPCWFIALHTSWCSLSTRLPLSDSSHHLDVLQPQWELFALCSCPFSVSAKLKAIRGAIRKQESDGFRIGCTLTETGQRQSGGYLQIILCVWRRMETRATEIASMTANSLDQGYLYAGNGLSMSLNLS